MSEPLRRRAFLKNTIAAGTGLAVGAGSRPADAAAVPQDPPPQVDAAPIDNVRIGFVGVGRRGSGLVRQLLRIQGLEIRAVCDIVEDKVQRTQQVVQQSGQPKPAGYSRGETDYRRMCDREDLDLVITATPWLLHVPVSVAAMNAGKHAATEVPAAMTVEGCWKLVEASEKNHRHCVLLENTCYFREVMCVLNLVRQGFFGEPMHAEAGYQKDARFYDLTADGGFTFAGEFSKNHKGNVYPTHDVGPLAQWMDINRGDRFDYLVAMAGNARSFNLYGEKYYGPDHHLSKTKFEMADISTCLIQTVKGRTIYLILDTHLSRAKARHIYRLMGTTGVVDATTDGIYLEGKSPSKDRWHGQWESLEEYCRESPHPLWRDLETKAIGSGHGGADYLCLYRLIESLRTGTPPEIDVYDAAAWSAIIELTDRSARNRSLPQEFPDFTRGKWKTNPPLPIRGAFG